MRIILMLLIFWTSGCAVRKMTDPQGYWNETKNASLHMSIHTFKQKHAKATIVVFLENKYPFPIVIPAGSIHLEVEGMTAVSESNPFWTLRPGDAVMSGNINFVYQEKFGVNHKIGRSIVSLRGVHQADRAFASQGTPDLSEGKELPPISVEIQ